MTYPDLATKKRAKITSKWKFSSSYVRWFAVMRSDGKTTTTTLIYNMLKEQGFSCWLGGNIGMPLLIGLMK